MFRVYAASWGRRLSGARRFAHDASFGNALGGSRRRRRALSASGGAQSRSDPRIAGRAAEAGTVLELASGTGEHAVHFAAALRHLVWQPTDPDGKPAPASAAHAAQADLPNLLPPLELDAAAPVWPLTRADAIVSINMIHISPWRGARPDGGRPHACYAGRPALPVRTVSPAWPLLPLPSNAAFDESLQGARPAWGVRDLDGVVAAGQTGMGSRWSARSRCRRTI